MLVVPKPRMLSSFNNVSLVLVNPSSLPVRSCLTKSMLMPLFASYSRKLALPWVMMTV
jgi:hypothetical protein